jgi:hypothetical protein
MPHPFDGRVRRLERRLPSGFGVIKPRPTSPGADPDGPGIVFPTRQEIAEAFGVEPDPHVEIPDYDARCESPPGEAES